MVLVKTPAAPSVFNVKFEIEEAAIAVLKFTKGSTMVIFPPVNAKFDVSILQEAPPKATEVAASPLLLLSITISPPVWLKILFNLCDMNPFTFTVPEVMVNVP